MEIVRRRCSQIFCNPHVNGTVPAPLRLISTPLIYIQRRKIRENRKIATAENPVVVVCEELLRGKVKSNVNSSYAIVSCHLASPPLPPDRSNAIIPLQRGPPRRPETDRGREIQV